METWKVEAYEPGCDLFLLTKRSKATLDGLFRNASVVGDDRLVDLIRRAPKMARHVLENELEIERVVPWLDAASLRHTAPSASYSSSAADIAGDRFGGRMIAMTLIDERSDHIPIA